MLNVLFFAGLACYFAAVILEFGGMVFKKEAVTKGAWVVFCVGAVCNTAYLAVRGIVAGRLPLSNQFEFATAFAWGIAVMLIFLQTRFKTEWIAAVAMPVVFLILSYAALQPREITELMPALRSAWFGLHIGSAVFSYAAFVLAGCGGVRYLLLEKRGGKRPSCSRRTTCATGWWPWDSCFLPWSFSPAPSGRNRLGPLSGPGIPRKHGRSSHGSCMPSIFTCA